VDLEAEGFHSREQPEFVQQREELSKQFRQRYRSDKDGKSNAIPYFIGVFDTVASLGNREFIAGALVVGLVLILVLSAIFGAIYGDFFRWLVYSLVGTATIVAVLYLFFHIKAARGLQGPPFWKTFHIAPARSKYYDQSLTIDVPFARHALSIDEGRASFDRVPWGEAGVWREGWLKQIWFAGNHSDIGGSYPENESRLSDIALDWMVTEARAAGLKCEDSVLRLFPSADGVEHDECKASLFRLAQKAGRSLKPDAKLHPTVLERLALTEVRNYSTFAPYRPEALRTHHECMHFYEVDDLIAEFGDGAVAEAQRRSSLPVDQANQKPPGFWVRVIDEINRRAPSSPQAELQS
jgi:hypothetical protein